MQNISLNPIPSQQLSILLNNQSCIIKVKQRTTGLYIDVYLETNPVVLGVLACDRAAIIRSKYLGFIGDLAFYDTLYNQDASYDGLGTRWLLGYFTPQEMLAFDIR